MPKAFSEHERAIIGKRLLEHGYRLFSAYGLKKTNVEEIAEACGISKGSFYSFYASKEALFMDVIEEAEVRMRREVMALIDQPGPTPRARLFTILKKAFDLFETMPILQFLGSSDFELLFRTIPEETVRQHLANDLAFFDALFARCREVGIPIQVGPEQIYNVLYPLVLTILHKDDSVLSSVFTNIDLHLELAAAYCLGEIDLKYAQPGGSVTEVKAAGSI